MNAEERKTAIWVVRRLEDYLRQNILDLSFEGVRELRSEQESFMREYKIERNATGYCLSGGCNASS